MKTVRIKTEGCAIYPHNTIHKVLDLNNSQSYLNTVYITENERDRIPIEWCEEVEPDRMLMLKGKRIASEKGTFWCIRDQQSYFWNEFRTLGYNAGTLDKTGKFTDKEYEEFENYSKENNLNIGKYE